MYITAYYASTSPVEVFRHDWRAFVASLLRDADCNGINVRPFALRRAGLKQYAKMADGWKRVR